MREYRIVNGTLVVNGESVPMSPRALRVTLLRLGHPAVQDDGEIPTPIGERIIELERGRALRELERLLNPPTDDAAPEFAQVG